MHKEVFEILRCPKPGQRLLLEEPVYEDERIRSGWLIAEDGRHRYQVRDFVPLVGRLLKRLLPIADYTGIFPLSKRQLQEWALLDTFDMLAPEYDNPQSSKAVRLWLEKAGLVDAEVCHAGHLVGRGLKPL
jgi:uncharacterized protein YbaR (Trm112 family)